LKTESLTILARGKECLERYRRKTSTIFGWNTEKNGAERTVYDFENTKHHTNPMVFEKTFLTLREDLVTPCVLISGIRYL
jgi:hypothetical protein